jgi:soluble cytochrome b562
MYEVTKEFGDYIIGDKLNVSRPDLARDLVNEGYVKEIEKAEKVITKERKLRK